MSCWRGPRFGRLTWKGGGGRPKPHRGYTLLRLSIRIFLIHCRNRPAPLAVKLPQQFLCRRFSALSQFFERLEIASFVGAVRIELLAAYQPDAGKRQRLARNRQQIAAV